MLAAIIVGALAAVLSFLLVDHVLKAINVKRKVLLPTQNKSEDSGGEYERS